MKIKNGDTIKTKNGQTGTVIIPGTTAHTIRLDTGELLVVNVKDIVAPKTRNLSSLLMIGIFGTFLWTLGSILVSLGVTVFILYAIIHFIMKYW